MSDILTLLKKADAVITDSHIVGTSGKHMSVYINKDALYPHTEMASEVGLMMAEKFKNAGVEAVVGPMLGGIILSQWTAYHLTRLTGKEVLSVYTEKDADGNQIFSRRRYDRHVKGKRTLVVEDVTNTGGSAKKVVETVKAAGGIVVALCVLHLNRSEFCPQKHLRKRSVHSVKRVFRLIRKWDTGKHFWRRNLVKIHIHSEISASILSRGICIP